MDFSFGQKFDKFDNNKNNKNINEKIDNLIKMVSKNMGITEEQVKQNLQNKDFENQKINEILNNPEKMKSLMSDPNIKKIIDKFFEK